MYRDDLMESVLSQIVWTPHTLMVVWILEFRLPVVGIGTLLQRMSDVRKQLVALSPSSLTTQWQYLHNGANWEEMTGIRVFLNSPKHSAVAILFLKYNLLVSEDMADKWSRVFRAASVGHSMIVNNEALRAVRKARVETVKAERLANWVADREALKAVIQSLKVGKKSLKADKKSLEADKKSLEHALHRSEHALHRSEADKKSLADECEALRDECEALKAQDNSLKIIIM